MLRADLQKAKLGDFGLSKEFSVGVNNEACVMSGQAGTARFMAPEVFLGQKNYTSKVDIYSVSPAAACARGGMLRVSFVLCCERLDKA